MKRLVKDLRPGMVVSFFANKMPVKLSNQWRCPHGKQNYHDCGHMYINFFRNYHLAMKESHEVTILHTSDSPSCPVCQRQDWCEEHQYYAADYFKRRELA